LEYGLRVGFSSLNRKKAALNFQRAGIQKQKSPGAFTLGLLVDV